MENVSKTMEEQLNLLLEEAEDELQQLEQDSLGCASRIDDVCYEAGSLPHSAICNQDLWCLTSRRLEKTSSSSNRTLHPFLIIRSRHVFSYRLPLCSSHVSTSLFP